MVLPPEGKILAMRAGPRYVVVVVLDASTKYLRKRSALLSVSVSNEDGDFLVRRTERTGTRSAGFDLKYLLLCSCLVNSPPHKYIMGCQPSAPPPSPCRVENNLHVPVVRGHWSTGSS